MTNLENKLEYFTMGMPVEVFFMIKRIHQVRERVGREGEEAAKVTILRERV